jgi:hypothetical protein
LKKTAGASQKNVTVGQRTVSRKRNNKKPETCPILHTSSLKKLFMISFYFIKII